LQADADARICLGFRRQQEILSERVRESRARGDTTEEETARRLLRRVEENELSYHQSRLADLAEHVLTERAPSGVISSDLPQLPEPERTVLESAATALAALRPALSAVEHAARGSAFYGAERFEGALDAFNAALAVAPDQPAILNNRGAALYRLGRHEEALADFDRSLQLRADDPGVLINHGVALNKLNRPEEALADLNRSLHLRPGDCAALGHRAAILSDLNRPEEALADYSRSLELKPDEPATLHKRGRTLRRLKRYEEALADYNRSLGLRPDQPSTLCGRAWVLSLMGRYEAALADLRQAIAGDGKYRRSARDDEEFEGLRNDPQWGPKFWELVGTED
jgi:tetratricopeptide (TPR) repeat protein